jgi:hypothetical protein
VFVSIVLNGLRLAFTALRLQVGYYLIEGILVEGIEQGLLGGGDGLGVEGSDFGRGAGLLDGAFGFGGQKGAVGLGVGIALGHSGGDAGGAGGGGASGLRSGSGLRCAAAAAVGGEALSGLEAERGGRSRKRCGIRPGCRGLAG